MNTCVAIVQEKKRCVCVLGLKNPVSSVSNLKTTSAFQIIVRFWWIKKILNQKENSTDTV